MGPESTPIAFSRHSAMAHFKLGVVENHLALVTGIGVEPISGKLMRPTSIPSRLQKSNVGDSNSHTPDLQSGRSMLGVPLDNQV